MSTASKFQKRLAAKIQDFAAASLNDTKWREILEVAITAQCDLQIASVWAPTRYQSAHIRVEQLDRGGIRDPGVGGPIYYREIYSLRIARFENERNSQTGAGILSEAKSLRLVAALTALGEIPLSKSEEFLQIDAYRR